MSTSHGHRLVIKWARTVHVYLTLFGFALLLFFAVTGFILNHEDWFGLDEPHKHERTGTMPVRFLKPLDKLAVVEALRADYGAVGALDSIKEDADGQRVLAVFKAPGRQIEAEIECDDGKTVVTHESRGALGMLTDMHRGKSSGAAWGLVIDAVSILFVIVSLTGLILWSSLRSRGKHGLLTIGLGLAAGLVVYFLFVP
jgi:hypothetical protein